MGKGKLLNGVKMRCRKVRWRYLFQHHDFMRSVPRIRIHSTPTELVLIPNQKICSAVLISGWFGISTAGINTRVIRAAPVWEIEALKVGLSFGLGLMLHRRTSAPPCCWQGKRVNDRGGVSMTSPGFSCKTWVYDENGVNDKGVLTTRGDVAICEQNKAWTRAMQAPNTLHLLPRRTGKRAAPAKVKYKGVAQLTNFTLHTFFEPEKLRGNS